MRSQRSRANRGHYLLLGYQARLLRVSCISEPLCENVTMHIRSYTAPLAYTLWVPSHANLRLIRKYTATLQQKVSKTSCVR